MAAILAGAAVIWLLVSAVLCMCMCALSGHISRRVEMEGGELKPASEPRASYKVLVMPVSQARPPLAQPLAPANLVLTAPKATPRPCPERETHVRRVVIEWQ